MSPEPHCFVICKLACTKRLVRICRHAERTGPQPASLPPKRFVKPAIPRHP